MSDLPPMAPVQSSNLHSVGHDDKALYVQFLVKGMPGPVYRYPTCGREHYDALVKADSPGRYHLDRIRHFHHGERVG